MINELGSTSGTTKNKISEEKKYIQRNYQKCITKSQKDIK